MKKQYVKPTVERIVFEYTDIITTSGYSGHYDANGKWHDKGNGNGHYGGVNYEGPNNGRGI